MKMVLFFILVLVNNLFSADWKFDSFGVSNVKSFYIDGNDIYAGSSGRVYLSTDNGDNWTLLNMHYQTKNLGNINAIVKNNNKLFVASTQGLYITSDLGKHWLIDTVYDKYSLERITEVYDIKKNENDIFIITDLGKLFKSIDDGVSWERITPNESVSLKKLSIDGNNIYVAGDTIAGYANLWISNDYGKNWRKIQDTLGGLKKVNIQALHAKEKNIYLSADYAKGFYYSKDDGKTWTKSDYQPFNILNIRSIITEGNAIICAGDMGYFTTSDWGKNWTETLIDEGVNQIAIQNINYYIATREGFGISEDSGKNFKKSNVGGGSTIINSLVEYNNTIYSGTYYYGAVQTRDYGLTWQKSNIFNQTDVSEIAFLDSNIFCTNPGPKKGQLKLSHDLGKNWKTLPTSAGIASIDIKCIEVDSNKRNVFVGNQFGLYISEDLGESWKLVHKDIEYSIPIDIIIVNDTIYFADPRSIYISTDYGLNWARKIIPDAFYKNANISSIALCENGIIAGTYSTADTIQGFFISEDMGDNWRKIIDSSMYYDIISLTTNENYIFAATKKGILYSNDCGENWSNIDDNFKLFQINNVLISGKRIFAATNEGIFNAKLSDFGITDVKEETNTAPDYLYSYPPYPTPSRDFVKVLVYYDQKTDIADDEISVVDIYGKIVAGKDDISIDKQTNYSAILTWNTVGVADGVYIILVNHGSKKRAIKVIVNK